MLTFEKYLSDLIRQVTVEWRDVLTDFMPREQIAGELGILQQAGVHYRIDGGYDEAERVRLYMTMFDETPTRADMNISVLTFTGNTKFIDFSHRDCLGALMSLGFERKCIGDIIVRENGFDVLTNSEIDDYLLLNALSIKRVPMRAKKNTLENWQAPERVLKMCQIQVAQPRLDAVIAKVFNLSRAQAVEHIRAGLVQVDHQVVLNPNRNCDAGQVLTVRGKGKCVVDEVQGVSKKGKIKLNVGKYV
ncbi:MAG: YlmH/Sll1252 family protein [Peptococcaceae bacterium]|nr:YlmH/Sll1252 family protein [Peptococcaceae bacterium]